MDKSPMSSSSHTPNLTLREVLSLVYVLVKLPSVILFNLVTAPWNARNQHKPWPRVITDSAVRYGTASLSVRQLQAAFPSTLLSYSVWAWLSSSPTLVEEIGENSRILWIGGKRSQRQRTILYFHGGGFVLGMQEGVSAFCQHLQLELERLTHDSARVAILNYSLAPGAPYPTQLRQAIAAVNHLVSQGIQPEDLYLAGDSAGGNLILQLLSHTLHPLPGDLAPPSPLSIHTPLAGAYLMSPWVALSPSGQGRDSFVRNDALDCLASSTLDYWAHVVSSSVPKAYRVHVEPATAPNRWWNDVERVVRRILITSGENECFHDGIAHLVERLKEDVPSGCVEAVVQKGAVHIEPQLDLWVRDGGRKGSLVPYIVKWMSVSKNR